jgi:hypothetical protein
VQSRTRVYGYSRREFEVEDESVIVILEKNDDLNDVDGVIGIDFATQWQISDK